MVALSLHGNSRRAKPTRYHRKMQYVRPGVLLVALLTGCGTKSVGLGLGEAPDARLTADLYTWPCQDSDTGTSDVNVWEGVFSYNLTLEYAPDGLVDRQFPTTGCSLTTDAFPVDAGSGGVDIPGVSEPGWSNGDLYGTMPRTNPGFYYKPVFANQRSCQEASDLLGEGTLLTDAGTFTNARTPAPGLYEGVEITGKVDTQTGIQFGDTVTVEWRAKDWSQSWVQLRREKGGQVMQAVTCNTDGMSAFTVDDAVWSMMSDALEVDVTNLYVVVQNSAQETMPDGQIIETSTRAMHVAVVQE